MYYVIARLSWKLQFRRYLNMASREREIASALSYLGTDTLASAVCDEDQARMAQLVADYFADDPSDSDSGKQIHSCNHKHAILYEYLQTLTWTIWILLVHQNSTFTQ